MLRKIRTARGLKISQLSQLAGICPSAISEYERGVKELSLKSIRRLARALHVQPGELLQPIDFDETPSDLNDVPDDVPDFCPYEDGYEPSDCEKCKYKDRCPFKYSEAEDE